MATEADALDPWKRIAAAMPGFEPRPGQVRMAEAVAAAIERRRHLVVEAGTGTGKSFAYLVPALAAVRKGLRVVVATRTIALQEQLVSKDVPLLVEALAPDVRAVLAKGRNNYVCRRRAGLAVADSRTSILPESAERVSQLERIVSWADEGGHDGSLSALGFQPDPSAWRSSRAESGNCLGNRCPFFDTCAYQESRRAVKSARLLVANHALVFLDLALRRKGARFLPDYDVLVLDEAHEAAGTATDALGDELSPGSVAGVLSRVASLLRRADVPGDAHREIAEAREAAEEFWKGVEGFRPAFIPDRRLAHEDEFPDPLTIRLDAVRNRMRRHAPKDAAIAPEWKARREELGGIVDRIAAFREMHDPEGMVRWVDSSRKGEPVLKAAPLDVASFLRDALFRPAAAAPARYEEEPEDEDRKPFRPVVVLTSATLRVGSGFGHLRTGLGIDDADELDVGSPFDFREQCLLALFPRLPEPKSAAEFEAAASDRMRDLVLGTKGGAFLLFASHGALGRAHERLAAEFDRNGLLVLRQGEWSPAEIAKAFRENPNCVLFGAATFWQGIDIQGDNLRLVVIHKIPFAVPTDPLEKARADAIERSGRNPFAVMSVPAAAIALKQGFGRLIRSRQDRGVVAILDPRMRTKAYGKTLLQSLPECRTEDLA
ncbi:MAG TPA: ATP-dependent DNA helicase [Planctomycetota bacterium]|nr:ATP-dependent DNA helicase [Planctomycetota bacterium]